MSTTPQLTHLIYYVMNPINSARLWESLLGLKRRMTHEFAAYTESEGMGVILTFANHGLAEGNYGTDSTLRIGSGNAELGIEVDDVDAWYQKAIGLGFKSVKAPEAQEWGQTTCYLLDPSGIRLSFFSPMED